MQHLRLNNNSEYWFPPSPKGERPCDTWWAEPVGAQGMHPRPECASAPRASMRAPAWHKRKVLSDTLASALRPTAREALAPLSSPCVSSSPLLRRLGNLSEGAFKKESRRKRNVQPERTHTPATTAQQRTEAGERQRVTYGGCILSPTCKCWISYLTPLPGISEKWKVKMTWTSPGRRGDCPPI